MSTKSWSKDRINEVYNQAKTLASTDKDFRAKLLDHPVEAIEWLTGEKLPEDLRMKVVENDPAYTATFILPPIVQSGELADDELDYAAGGANSCTSDACASKS